MKWIGNHPTIIKNYYFLWILRVTSCRKQYPVNCVRFKGIYLTKMDALLLKIQLGHFKINIVIIDLTEWCSSAKWCLINDFYFLSLTLINVACISPNKKIGQFSILYIVLLQIKLDGNGWESLSPPLKC